MQKKFAEKKVTAIKILDLGCGNKKMDGAVGIDVNKNTAADVIHDLNNFPYPFSDSEFDMINADNVIEHLEDVVMVMTELHRIGKPGALVKIEVPYFRSRWAFVDPTHKHYFSYESFNYFLQGHYYHEHYRYSDAVYELKRITFNDGIYSGSVVKNWVVALANRYPNRYERFLANIFPLDQLTFEIIVRK